MNNNILSLRKLNLMRVGIIYLVAGLIVGFEGLSILLYVPLAVKAIDDDNKAKTTSYIFMIAYLILLVGFVASIISSYDFIQMWMDVDRHTDEDTALLMKHILSNASPYMVLMGIISISGFLYAAKDVMQKFKTAWWLILLSQVIFTWGAICVFNSKDDFLFMINPKNDTFNTCRIISWILMAIATIILIYMGRKENVANTEHTQTLELKDKGQELMKLKELLDADILSQEEFDAEKRKILNS